MQPEAQKLNKAEQRKLQENLCNYTSIMKKFLNINGWPKSATYLENLYAESEEPMPITPLYLHNHSISDPILLHVLKHISTKQHKQIQVGNKYKISKNTFKELLIACQRRVKFLSKVRKVATRLMDRDFIHLKNKVATGEWEQLLLILSNPHIKIEDVIQELQERIQKEKEEKEKAEEKEKRRAKAKGKRKSTNSAEEPFKPAQTHNKTRSNQKLLHKCIKQLQVTHTNPKLVNIILCNISIDASTHHWDQHRLNQMMGYTNPNQHDCFAAILTTNVLEMAALLNLLANENSPWQLLCLISGSIPNICSKSASGVQHNGLYTIFISQANKSYTFNPESLLVQDIAKIPKLMAYKKPSLIVLKCIN
ncbi:uncharacterized protein ACA1_059170 [Acanthamoeba castellanii str. Neff]|uniref:Uncharacterized protein n=1 Tax=Acanthamoeba castellanii (strain ATCC 30010 / Neff) TaxID=1257118 RepID=L8GW49_ACACF|nr:uncharacterized protein ACA1_059170 [Acanthamoeba castellanii str. Neff]ELR17230.1 hypothetical protein ACA1_059170 [Acanthamoeba castellanii str. Neff]